MPTTTWANCAPRCTATRSLFAKYGGRKPIWSTEIGSNSQGLPRDVIARDLVRKATCFFADGGEFFCWFAVGGMPDPDGTRVGRLFGFDGPV